MLALTLEWMVVLFLPLEDRNTQYHSENMKCKDDISIILIANLLLMSSILNLTNEMKYVLYWAINNNLKCQAIM